ncbi:hypothetical protein MSHOH_2864 [Methanosarcina horonobensis HB-1 = JCM 15518]|uniref:HTH arsR-type domain-containing protein n=2 Tax=Methanosarcina horonobensis TaxID=418008 RepID=A0A0E3SG97_9EURY|nr:hypothetical protein MSHOH_2864 [Methanosarcina horonobensis HB-1 = JCM 15518]
MSHSINHRKLWLLFFFSLFFVLTAEATEYIVSPAPGDEFGVSRAGEEVTVARDFTVYWQFLLWLALMHVLSIIDILLNPAKLIFAILGFRITGRADVPDNSSQSKVYAYIKARPGAYISEIVNNVTLNRGAVKYHIKTLKAQNKIEAYKEGGKTRYFGSDLACDNEEKRIISALQNIMNQRIISEIRNDTCNTNVALACEIGVSRATISWHMRRLKEIGLVKETKKGKNIIYEINPSYNNLIEKHE